MANNFLCPIDNDEKHVMHSRINNVEIQVNEGADEVIKKHFHSLKNRYENDLGSIKGSEFVFNSVRFLYYKCHKINQNCGESHIDFPDWIKNKKVTIIP